MEGNTNTQYTRVSPRDLFNEAKLLKCLGHLALMIHDNKLQGITFSDSGIPFKIGLHDAGYLTATQGVKFKKDGELIWLGTSYNSKANYPLICMADYEEIQVFDESGAITDDFFEYANS
jgi:hypothetical protein